jgi:endoglucanase
MCCNFIIKYSLAADLDDAYWGGDENIPTNRPSYFINDTKPGTDAAAGASAAFSACAALYANQGFNGSYSGPASLRDETYAQTLLTHAQQLYTFAVNATGGQKAYQSSVSAVAESYGSTSYGDDLTIAALFLAWANSSSIYYQEAQQYFQQYKLSGQGGVFNWDSKTPGIYVLFAEIAQSSSGLGGNLATWQAECEKYFDAIVNNAGPAFLTNGLANFYCIEYVC